MQTEMIFPDVGNKGNKNVSPYVNGGGLTDNLHDTD